MQVSSFKTIEEVIERANDTSYGLAAGVCTRDIGKALRVANQIRAGTIRLCDTVFSTQIK